MVQHLDGLNPNHEIHATICELVMVRPQGLFSSVDKSLESARLETARVERFLSACLAIEAATGRNRTYAGDRRLLRSALLGEAERRDAAQTSELAFCKQDRAVASHKFQEIPYFRKRGEQCKQSLSWAGRRLVVLREPCAPPRPRSSATRDRWQRLARRLLLNDAIGRRLYRNVARAKRAARAALRPRWWRQNHPPLSRLVTQFRTALVGTLTRTAPPLATVASGMAPGQPSRSC